MYRLMNFFVNCTCIIINQQRLNKNFSDLSHCFPTNLINVNNNINTTDTSNINNNTLSQHESMSNKNNILEIASSPTIPIVNVPNIVNIDSLNSNEDEKTATFNERISNSARYVLVVCLCTRVHQCMNQVA